MLVRLINNKVKAAFFICFIFLVSCAIQSPYQQELYVAEEDIATLAQSNELNARHLAYSDSIWPGLVRGFNLRAKTSNTYYRYYLEHFSKGPQYFERKIRNTPYYLYYVFNEVKRRNMPAELALLPIVESQYESFAYSYARASGIWQIVPGTARHLNLSMDWWYDERRDVRLATDAALNYLQSLHQRFGNWLLALAAYNAGPGTLSKAIKKSGTKNFWRLDLPEQTKKYVPKLLAIAYVARHHKKFGVSLPAIANAPYFVTIELSAPVHLKDLAQKTGLPFPVLEKLNPGYNQWVTPPRRNNSILVPRYYLSKVKLALQALRKNGRYYWLSYQVKAGDSLPVIAKKYHTRVEDIVNINHLPKSMVTRGQLLLIPVAANKVNNEMLNSSLAKGRKPQKINKVHYVKEAESLWSIARSYGLSVKDLAAFNGINAKKPLRVKQKLVIPVQIKSSAYKLNPKHQRKVVRKVSYLVKSGDSLYRIANRFNVTVKQIKDWNDSVKSLRTGRTLTLFVDVTEI